MGYTAESHLVRADFFKATGKWMQTVALDMKGHYNDTHPVMAVEQSLAADPRLAALAATHVVVVLEPYHRSPYPVCRTPKPVPGS